MITLDERAPTSYQQQSEFYLTFMRIRTGRNTYEPKERRADAFLFALNLRNRKPPGPYIPKTVKKTIPERSQKNQEHYRTSDAHSLASIARNLCLISTLEKPWKNGTGYHAPTRTVIAPQ
jgi:hypothetical protein